MRVNQEVGVGDIEEEVQPVQGWTGVVTDHEAFEHQAFEAEWWGDCCNTYLEETMQLTSMRLLGYTANQHWSGHWPSYDLEGKSVIDVGGGPISPLLKAVNGRKLKVLDPCPYPDWTLLRYEAHGIEVTRRDAEEHQDEGYDEAWIMNVLEHVKDPQRVVAKAKEFAKVVRVVEFIRPVLEQGHPHVMSKDALDGWLGIEGTVESVNENALEAEAYSGTIR